MEDYGTDDRFRFKRPAVRGEQWRRDGDNIYTKNPDGSWRQRWNRHHLEKDKLHDLGGKNVLVCRRFWYFGREAPMLPLRLTELVKRGPGHRCVDDPSIRLALLRWLRRYPYGVRGAPYRTR